MLFANKEFLQLSRVGHQLAVPSCLQHVVLAGKQDIGQRQSQLYRSVCSGLSGTSRCRSSCTEPPAAPGWHHNTSSAR